MIIPDGQKQKMSFIQNFLPFTLLLLVLTSFSDCSRSDKSKSNSTAGTDTSEKTMSVADSEKNSISTSEPQQQEVPDETSQQGVTQNQEQQEPRKGPPPRPLEPSWTGGNYDAIQDFFKKHVRYPEEAKKNNIKGTVYVMFTVKANGETDNFKIRQGLGYGCDEEAIRVIKKLGKWNPGKVGGKEIDMEYSLGVPFGE